MTIRRKFIIAFAILFWVSALAGGYLIWRTQKIQKYFNNEIPNTINSIAQTSKLDGYSHQIKYFDEVLTQSARNYAFTGNVKWKARYTEEAPKLDDIIKKAITEGDEKDKEIFSSVDEANIALVAMEENSINLVDKGNRAGAIEILDSSQYWQQKDVYKNGLQGYLDTRDVKYDDALSVSTNTLDTITNAAKSIITGNRWVLIFFFIILVIIIFVILSVIYYSVLQPIAKLKEASEKIAQGDLDQKVDIVANDEIGILSNSFNNMAKELKESRENIETKITERTNELEEAKIKDEAYLTSIGDGLIVVDKDEKILLTNPQVENILGFSEKELLGKTFSSVIRLVNEEGKEIFEKDRPIKKVLLTGKKETYTDLYYLKKNKTKVPVALTTAPVIIKDKITGAIDVFRDISREKEIDKAKTEFVSLASHQLRTPLSAINWYAEMLMAGDAGKLNPEQKKYLCEVYKGNQRMVELVNSLLNVSRLELGTFAIEPKPTDFIETSQSVIKELTPQIKKKKLSVMEKYPKKIEKILADPKLSRIILQNLLSNAVKYTPDKGKISVALKKEADSLHIEVTDTGLGIPKKQQSKIFTKLFRADNVKEKDTEGTGLGLYLVKAIVDNANGKVWFNSVENKGTTFFVDLPLSGMQKKEGNKGFEESIY